jgi:uncharacterized DUF497 family protein
LGKSQALSLIDIVCTIDDKAEMNFEWDEEKELWLRKHRDLSFQLAVRALAENEVVADIANAAEGRGNQRLMLFHHKEKICVVPYVSDGKARFLKTMFLSRDYTKIYGGKKDG